MKNMRTELAIAGVVLALSLAGCGGGGGGGSSSSSPSPPAPPQNVQAISVDAGPANFANIAFTSVTVCAPGSTTNCQTIDHIQVDTGSSGLRLISSVLSPALSLKQQTDANGNPMVECAQFADGFSWGPVKMADIRIAGEAANSVPVQVIGDPAFTTIPPACSSAGPPENTVQDFGANGLLGVGLFLQDCGSACAQTAFPGGYYICPVAGCVPVQVPVAQQLQNPVAMFSADNNGVVIALPAIPPAGQATAAGSLIFGIGTQANNALGGATVLTTDPNTGYVTTLFNGVTYTTSYIDAGSSLYFIATGLYPICGGVAAGFYCPPTTQNLAATIQGTNGNKIATNFSIANALQLFTANPSFFAFNDLAAPAGDPTSFAWGMPLFYGKNVFTAIEGRSTPGGTGPYFAF
jgi:hypothetical protein